MHSNCRSYILLKSFWLFADMKGGNRAMLSEEGGEELTLEEGHDSCSIQTDLLDFTGSIAFEAPSCIFLSNMFKQLKPESFDGCRDSILV